MLTRGATPVKWATVTNYLANAYAERVRDNRADNLERAIHDYQQALEELPRDMTPALWAQAMPNLAAAHADRPRGDRAGNLEQAIRILRASLGGAHARGHASQLGPDVP